jgi:hypothetical protein
MHFYHLKLLPAMQWKIEPLALATHLTEWWNYASISLEDVSATPDVLLWWEITFKSDSPKALYRTFINGKLDRDGSTIRLVGSFEMCIEFALHYRALIPNTIRVSLHEIIPTEEGVIELYPHTTKQEIFAMFIPKIDPVAWRILQILRDNSGLYQHHLLVQALEAGDHQTQDTPSIQQIHAIIYDLWRREYISSPGVRWLPERPASIDGIFDDEAWNQMMLSLSHTGERALIAYRMLMKL